MDREAESPAEIKHNAAPSADGSKPGDTAAAGEQSVNAGADGGNSSGEVRTAERFDRKPRHKGKRRDGRKGGRGDDRGQKGQVRQEFGRAPQPEVDPNSPFAVLAKLKGSIKSDTESS